MPSTRKRIGYLPSINAHESITQIATKEKLSQTKVVGILVEEALIARDELDVRNSVNIRKKPLNKDINNIDKSSLNYNDFDELISDKGITYNKKKTKTNSEQNSFKSTEKYNKELFEQFKQFIIFQRMFQNK